MPSGRRRDIARQRTETVRYFPTGNPGEYAPYQARFLHRPEKVTRSDAPPTPGEPNHNEPYRAPRPDVYRRIAAHSRRVIPCHREPLRRVTPKRSTVNHCEPYRNTEPTNSDEAGPQHSATFQEPRPPGIHAILPVVPPPAGEYAAEAYRPGTDEREQCESDENDALHVRPGERHVSAITRHVSDHPGP